MKPKQIFVIVHGNRYQEGPIKIQSVADSLEKAQAHLRLIEELHGKSEYEEENCVGYSKEDFYYIQKFILNAPPDWVDDFKHDEEHIQD